MKMAVAACFTFSMGAMVQGHHVYQSTGIWEAAKGKILECSQVIGNRSNPYAVAVVKNFRGAGGKVTFGHAVNRISSSGYIFIQCEGIIYCMVHNWWKADLVQR